MQTDGGLGQKIMLEEDHVILGICEHITTS